MLSCHIGMLPGLNAYAHTVALSLHVRLAVLPGATAARRGRHGNAHMIVWIWDASGPAADACGVAGTPEGAPSAAGSLLESGQAQAARVEQAAIVLGTTLTYGYCPTG